VGALVDAKGEDQNYDLEEDDDDVQTHKYSSLLNFA
jgi:hypothetical protein